jgi:hypothetical protein
MRLVLRNLTWAMLSFAAVCFYWLDTERMLPPLQGPLDEQARCSPPAKEMPPPSREAVIHEHAAALHLPVDLDGVAVVYPEEVDSLVRDDGSFRADLSLSEVAGILKIGVKTISLAGSQREIDSDATLFVVKVGRLTEDSKARARRHRELEAHVQREIPLGDYEWITADVGFTLNSLRHPTSEQRLILGGISHWARRLPPKPGGAVRALSLESAPGGGRPQPFEFSGGMLPLERLPAERLDPGPP